MANRALIKTTKDPFIKKQIFLKIKKPKVKLKYKPPVLRTTGIDPYRIAVSWVRPQGSKIDGTKMKSAPA